MTLLTPETALDRAHPLPAGLALPLRAERARALRRVVVVNVVLAVAVLGAGCWSVGVGSYPIAPWEILPALLGDSTMGYVVGSLRLPRALTGILVGIAFGMSGAIFQSMARNALASPDIIGITAGASVGAVVVLVFVGPFSGLVTLGALGGAVGLSLLIFTLALGSGLSPFRLILVGIGVQAMAGAVIEFLLARARSEIVLQSTGWIIGSLNARSWTDVLAVGAALLVLVPVLAVTTRALRGMVLGDDTATATGVAVGRNRVVLILAGCALAAAGVAAAGPVTLVGFLGPPIARWLTRSPGPAFIASGLTGALVLTVADVIARIGWGEVNLPVGIVTGLVGAPYLIFLLIRANKVGSVG